MAKGDKENWRSQKRDPRTGKWIDETVGAGFEGKPRKVNPNFGAHPRTLHRQSRRSTCQSWDPSSDCANSPYRL